LPARQREFGLPAYKLAALEWGEPGSVPVIALHGWLDNAGSFSPLAPLLHGCHIIAFDAAGHGRSGDRSIDAGYNIWQDLTDIVEVAEQLGWTRFNLLGHSRGAAIATLFAGTYPDPVQRLMLVEGGLPIMGTAAEAPENLARVLARMRELSTRSGRVFASREQAIAERMDGFSPVSLAAAEILAERSLDPVEGGWRWRADQRLKAGSEFRLTQSQVAAFVDRAAAPAIAVFAEESPFADLADYVELMRRFRQIEIHRLPGRHHFHLEGAAEPIADLLLRFIAST
jgi:pimeloyl-ACP methyl ester carboxylesterase